MDKIISVVIPTYNRKVLTDRAVESVTSSQSDFVEIIVVDDCGNEPYIFDTQENKCGIAIRVIKNTENGGAGLARMAGVNVAEGALIAFLDSDDEFDHLWIDSLIEKYNSQDVNIRGSSVYIGKTHGGNISHRMVWHLMHKIPDNMKLFASRIVAVFFNPFYTSSVAISRSICTFHDRLRYCEDYYTMVGAIFRAKRLLIVDALGCKLGRDPNSSGGLSDVRFSMFKGELVVRLECLKARYIPLQYKVVVPLGMFYQLLRSLGKVLIRPLSKLRS